jgi:hypothetical protein
MIQSRWLTSLFGLFFWVLPVIAPATTGADRAILVTPGWLNEHSRDPDLVILTVAQNA